MPTSSAGKVSRCEGGKRGARGFTLLELLVVVALMSLMAGMVVPRMAGSLDRMNARTAARKVSAALRHARSQAAAEKKTFVVQVNFSERTLAVTAISHRAGSSNSMTREGNPASALTLPAAVRFVEVRSSQGHVLTEGLFEVRFTPFGGSSGGEIILGDEENRRFRISLDPLTGLNEIHAF
jgi:type II secretion system protein H